MMKKDNIWYLYLIICIIWMVATLYYDYTHPITLDSLSVEERIRYEQIIFP